ncbi:AhpC-TSA-domain-containing protein [Meredithblackwellia eburnea MCA 4105]
MGNAKELVGKQAPDFSLPSSDGTEFKLSEHLGKTSIAIFFFPAQDTPVCDAEACSFEKAYPDVGKVDSPLLVVGVSYTSPSSLQSWKEKKKINYPILSDEGQKVANGTFKLGSSFFGLLKDRATFFIDKKGVVRGVLDGGLAHVQAEKHVSFIKDWVKKAEAEA